MTYFHLGASAENIAPDKDVRQTIINVLKSTGNVSRELADMWAKQDVIYAEIDEIQKEIDSYPLEQGEPFPDELLRLFAQQEALQEQCDNLSKEWRRKCLNTAAENIAPENKPVERAREVITDLKAGRIPGSVVRDLGEAVSEASRNSGVNNAIGRNWNR